MIEIAAVDSKQELGPPLDWSRLYLVGWYDQREQAYLTSWFSVTPVSDFVVVGRGRYGPPMWKAPIPEGCLAYGVPSGRDPQEYALEMVGVHAIGWITPEPFERE